MNQVGFWRRFFAEFLDGLIIMGAISLILKFVFQINNDDIDTYSRFLYAFYATLLPIWWGGHIVGKRILNIHVTRIDEEPLTLWTMIKCEIIGKQLLTIVTLGKSIIVSAFMVGLSGNRRAIHDYIAGTEVVDD